MPRAYARTPCQLKQPTPFLCAPHSFVSYYQIISNRVKKSSLIAIALLHPQRHDWCILLMECFVAYKGRIPHFYLYEVPEYIIISSPHLALVAPLLGGYHENYGS